ncbi:MAG TPA: thermonuclease family protein [Candidatus Saccharimonadales bacterium]|nr:thermonuclease family protein [Candidatus Saccharimonadales bacterium]
MARRPFGISKKHLSWLSLLIALFVTLGQYYGWFDALNKQVEVSQPGLYSVDHFVDGDTIAVRMNGHNETIRFIGVDTPETHKPNTPVQCYGPAAAAFTKNTIGNQKVRLALDPKSSNRDRYDRLLRYVYLPDGTLLNEKLIEDGYGFYYPYFPFTKSSEFARAERSAQAAHRGLWGNCRPTPTDDGGYKMNEPAP